MITRGTILKSPCALDRKSEFSSPVMEKPVSPREL